MRWKRLLCVRPRLVPWLALGALCLCLLNYSMSPFHRKDPAQSRTLHSPNTARVFDVQNSKDIILKVMREAIKRSQNKKRRHERNSSVVIEDNFAVKWPWEGIIDESDMRSITDNETTIDIGKVIDDDSKRKLYVIANQPVRILAGSQPIPIVGTSSFVSVNTSGTQPAMKQLKLLQTLMFRNRPPDSTYNINATLSDMTPLDRDVPDGREPECARIDYKEASLPMASVIIPFYNEPLSMLLRTLHSILNRTPETHLQEIILVDDLSENLDLGVPLEKYIQLLPKVILVRNRERLGLIRARQLGAGLARAPVLVFLDAHTECNIGWLQPLLAQIREDRDVIVQPMIDNIHANNLVYEPGYIHAVPRSSFTWDLRLVWTRIPEHELRRRTNINDPFQSPVVVGCAMAVHKAYFEYIRGFDEGMGIWGGENFEVPFRTWLCGGRVLTIPCSRVGHTFRKLPYLTGDTPSQIERNLLRTSELWMGDYKKYVYASIPEEYQLNDSDWKSIEKRRRELSHLNCKSFDWLLQTLMPETPLPPDGVVFFGEVGNFRWSACLAVSEDGSVDMTTQCFQARVLPENFFYIDRYGRFIHAGDGRCVRMDADTKQLYVTECGHFLPGPEDGRWDFRRSMPRRGGQLILTFPGEKVQCMTQVTSPLAMLKRWLIQMHPCKKGMPLQVWIWTYDFNMKRMAEHGTSS